MVGFCARRPVLVVTSTTPLAACEPYTALLLGSFNTSTLATSAGLMSESRPVKINPSTMIKGAVLPFNVEVPRMLIEASCPGRLVWLMVKPGSEPLSDWRILTLGASLKAVRLAEAIEPVKSFFFWVPYPTTTTSLSSASSGTSWKLMLV